MLPTSPGPQGRPGPASRRAGLLGLLACLAAVAFSTWTRVHVALADPAFEAAPAGLLRSDPALLFALAEDVVEGGGLPPASWRADPRLEHPRLIDVPAQFTVGQELLAAWAWLALGGRVPLHLVAVGLFAATASLVAAGAYGAALARTARPGLAAAAAWLVVLVPGSYRTIGFVLVREDLSFPLWALHVAALARAARTGRGRDALLAGALLAAALATWHAMGFVVAVEAAVLVAAAAATGRAPRPRLVALALVPVAAAGVLVPALAAKAFVVSLPMQLGAALLAACVAAARGRGAAGRAAAAAATWGAVLALALVLARLPGSGAAGYAHVYEVLAAKARHLGELPADPAALSFDARLLWQGPFATATPERLVAWLGWAWLGLPAAAWLATARARSAQREADRALGLLALASLPVAWLVERTVIVPALLLPVALAVAAARLPARGALVGGALVLLAQAAAFGGFVARHRLVWYLPPERRAELARLAEVVPALVPDGEPVLADFVDGPVVLAFADRPICLQPKYETDASRRDAQAFLGTFFHGSPEDLRRLARQRFRARHLLVDRLALGREAAYAAGLRPGEAPRPGTAAAALLSTDAATLEGVPGYRLLWRSELPSDLLRLYRLEDPPTSR